LQATPVTRGQYRLYDAKHELIHTVDWLGVSDAFTKRAPKGDCPMINVTWYDAWVFARWIGGRLPTEAEWEYACRAGTQTTFSFGDDDKELGKYAWFADNADGQTHPVGQKMPNRWGLYDMPGNVDDWFDEEYYAKSPKEDPPGPSDGSIRVFRGGGWWGVAGGCRAAYSTDMVSVAALQKAKKLVQELGGVKEAKQALAALGQLLD
jgi:formylglycine-generating enzyme required for sulfatase activity